MDGRVKIREGNVMMTSSGGRQAASKLEKAKVASRRNADCPAIVDF